MSARMTPDKPSALLKAFYGVMLGHNYSHELARYLKVSQPAAQKFLKQLESGHLIKSEKIEGRILKYSPNWKKIAEDWIDFLKQNEAGWKLVKDESGSSVKLADDYSAYEQLKRSAAFYKLVEIYFGSMAAEFKRFRMNPLSLSDAYVFFSDYVREDLLKSKEERVERSVYFSVVRDKIPFVVGLREHPAKRYISLTVANTIFLRFKEYEVQPEYRKLYAVYVEELDTLFRRK